MLRFCSLKWQTRVIALFQTDFKHFSLFLNLLTTASGITAQKPDRFKINNFGKINT